jgi:hypothetical protein
VVVILATYLSSCLVTTHHHPMIHALLLTAPTYISLLSPSLSSLQTTTTTNKERNIKSSSPNFQVRQSALANSPTPTILPYEYKISISTTSKQKAPREYDNVQTQNKMCQETLLTFTSCTCRRPRIHICCPTTTATSSSSPHPGHGIKGEGKGNWKASKKSKKEIYFRCRDKRGRRVVRKDFTGKV